MKTSVICYSEEETCKLAKIISECCFRGFLVTLNGELGAGKTRFSKALGEELGVKQTITSPTFNILKCYFEGKYDLYHIDAYRLENGENVDIGLEEVIEGDGITLVEWSSFIEDMLFEPLKIRIEVINETERRITFSSEYEKYNKVFETLREYK